MPYTAIAFLLKLIGQGLHVVFPHLDKKITPDYTDQHANDFIRHQLQTCKGGYMISKFGTYELKAFLNFNARSTGLRSTDVLNILRHRYVLFRNPKHTMKRLCNNAGFFPNDIAYGPRYAQLIAEDWRQIDILGTYQREDYYPISFGTNPTLKTVNIEGYYAPFFWKNPWSEFLRDKRVLVVHPFTESIRKQYARREELFEDTDVLPPFKELITLKAVQAIASNETTYTDWFEALHAMEEQMDLLNYDVALIGCGAFGMNLAAHAKRQGKIAIHLAGMIQMLFGIYGERWINDPRYKPFINKSWIRPTSDETPKRAEAIENGCYW